MVSLRGPPDGAGEVAVYRLRQYAGPGHAVCLRPAVGSAARAGVGRRTAGHGCAGVGGGRTGGLVGRPPGRGRSRHAPRRCFRGLHAHRRQCNALLLHHHRQDLRPGWAPPHGWFSGPAERHHCVAAPAGLDGAGRTPLRARRGVPRLTRYDAPGRLSLAGPPPLQEPLRGLPLDLRHSRLAHDAGPLRAFPPGGPAGPLVRYGRLPCRS